MRDREARRGAVDNGRGNQDHRGAIDQGRADQGRRGAVDYGRGGLDLGDRGSRHEPSRRHGSTRRHHYENGNMDGYESSGRRHHRH